MQDAVYALASLGPKELLSALRAIHMVCEDNPLMTGLADSAERQIRAGVERLRTLNSKGQFMMQHMAQLDARVMELEIVAANKEREVTLREQRIETASSRLTAMGPSCAAKEQALLDEQRRLEATRVRLAQTQAALRETVMECKARAAQLHDARQDSLELERDLAQAGDVVLRTRAALAELNSLAVRVEKEGATYAEEKASLLLRISLQEDSLQQLRERLEKLQGTSRNVAGELTAFSTRVLQRASLLRAFAASCPQGLTSDPNISNIVESRISCA